MYFTTENAQNKSTKHIHRGCFKTNGGIAHEAPTCTLWLLHAFGELIGAKCCNQRLYQIHGTPSFLVPLK